MFPELPADTAEVVAQVVRRANTIKEVAA
jgi:hypothetical protein